VAVSGADFECRSTRLIEAKKGDSIARTTAANTGRSSPTTTASASAPGISTHVWADPKNVSTVYIADTGLFRSVDGGKTWDRLNAPHGDHHGLWVDPTIRTA